MIEVRVWELLGVAGGVMCSSVPLCDQKLSQRATLPRSDSFLVGQDGGG
jgi:hypothetical protein